MEWANLEYVEICGMAEVGCLAANGDLDSIKGIFKADVSLDNFKKEFVANVNLKILKEEFNQYFP